jgi:hypothetical protein
LTIVDFGFLNEEEDGTSGTGRRLIAIFPGSTRTADGGQ